MLQLQQVRRHDNTLLTENSDSEEPSTDGEWYMVRKVWLDPTLVLPCKAIIVDWTASRAVWHVAISKGACQTDTWIVMRQTICYK